MTSKDKELFKKLKLKIFISTLFITIWISSLYILYLSFIDKSKDIITLNLHVSIVVSIIVTFINYIVIINNLNKNEIYRKQILKTYFKKINKGIEYKDKHKCNKYKRKYQ